MGTLYQTIKYKGHYVPNAMKQNTDTTDATLTEYLSAVDNTDDSIDGPAKLTSIQLPTGVWSRDEGQPLDEDPAEYRVECSCGETFGNWGAATDHAENEHTPSDD